MWWLNRKICTAPSQCPGLTKLPEHPAGEGGTVVPVVMEPKDFKEYQRQRSHAVKAQPWLVENPGLIGIPSAMLGPLEAA